MILEGSKADAIERAAQALADGELLGLPTETVYGLAANADNDAAVRAIFAAKGRPNDHPLIVHVAGAAGTADFAAEVPTLAHRLIDAFWPGPLTLILPRRAGVAEAAAAGHPGIAVRSPAHPVAQALLAACAARGIHGLAAPSANRFGRISPTTAAHVAGEFGNALLVLDGGACAVGIESAIVDLSRGAPTLLRPGQLSRAEIEAAAGCRLPSKDESSASPTPAPGTLAAHYAPRAKLRLMAPHELRAALQLLGDQARQLAVWSRTPLRSASHATVLRRMPDDAATAARQLFAVLRDFDNAGVKLIWVETPPTGDPAWEGIRDRLERAAAG
ncbi:MAG: threonylcarbamoyl-AMP synthase [Burkholderiaceae bacterium]|jgi:L-threonylcarbamoyladenylate synthase|nr:threonylcarbamoyl-AMP synthase [Burkholderiaceae bacterium]